MRLKTLLPAVLLCSIGLLLLCSNVFADDISTGMNLLNYVKVTKQFSSGTAPKNMSYGDAKTFTAGLNYIQGFRDGNFGSVAAFGASVPYLIPDGVTNGQLALVIEKYLGEHPEKLNDPASALLYNCFAEAFPNPKYKPSAIQH